MSETVLKFFLSELNIVRLHCPNALCRAVTELPLENLARSLSGQWVCQVCRENLIVPGQANLLGDFARKVQALNSGQNCVKIEFVLPNAD